MDSTKRQVYFDVLRIIAILCVLFNHSGESGYFIFTLTDKIPLQIISILVSSLSKMGVPLFFMISGALLLKKEESLKDLYLKRVLRYIIIIFVFCGLYYFYQCQLNHTPFDFKEMIRQTTTGQTQTSYWFLYSYLGFLVSLPLLRKIATAFSEKDYIYLICLYITGVGIFGLLARTFIGQIVVYIPFAVDILAYPLLGYFFAEKQSSREDSRKILWLMIFLAIIGLILNIAITEYDNYLFKGWNESGLSAFVILPTIATFYITKYIFDRVTVPSALRKILCTLGSCTFGVYVLECYIKAYFGPYLQRVLAFLPYTVENMLYIVLIMLTGCGVTYIFKKIPVVQKLL